MSFGSSASGQKAVQVIFIVASQIRTSQIRLLRFAMLEIKFLDNPLSAANQVLSKSTADGNRAISRNGSLLLLGLLSDLVAETS